MYLRGMEPVRRDHVTTLRGLGAWSQVHLGAISSIVDEALFVQEFVTLKPNSKQLKPLLAFSPQGLEFGVWG